MSKYLAMKQRYLYFREKTAKRWKRKQITTQTFMDLNVKLINREDRERQIILDSFKK